MRPAFWSAGGVCAVLFIRILTFAPIRIRTKEPQCGGSGGRVAGRACFSYLSKLAVCVVPRRPGPQVAG